VKSWHIGSDADARAFIKGACSQLSTAYDQAMLASSCGLNALLRASAAAAIDSRSGMSGKSSFENAHAVFASSCGKNSELRFRAAEASAAHSGACRIRSIEHDHAGCEMSRVFNYRYDPPAHTLEATRSTSAHTEGVQ